MEYAEQRIRMVEDQLARRGIRAPGVLEAFRKVPRHHFVPAAFRDASYADHPLPIGHGQTISQPYIVALMTESLRLKGGEKVLEVGTGSGYQAAILAEICREVCTIEREEALLRQAERLLSSEGYKNIKFVSGDGTKGFRDEAPYDGILVTAAAPFVPEALKAQLADGGRIVIPVGSIYSQVLVAVEKKGKDFTQEDICGCVFVPLIGEDGWKERPEW